MYFNTLNRSGATAAKHNQAFAQGITRSELGRYWVHPRNRVFFDRPPSVTPRQWYECRGFQGGR